MKTTKRWLLLRHLGSELIPLRGPFNTKEEAEKERSKHPEIQRKPIALGLVRSYRPPRPNSP